MNRQRILIGFVAVLVAGCGALGAPASDSLPSPVAVSQASPAPSGLVLATSEATAPARRASASNDTLTVETRRYPSPIAPYAAYVYVPPTTDSDSPLQVVLALHGMYGEGKAFASALAGAAERHRWLLLAPTISYGDWYDPEKVAIEDSMVMQRLHATILNLEALTGRRLATRVKLFGFSRGAQVAHRFALAYPEDVSSVVAYSAGTYTLPLASADIDADGKPDTLNFPYGTADFNVRVGRQFDRAQVRQVRFLVGVGANDNRPGDVPRQWDSYVGKSRVERARQFYSALQKSGTSCTLKVFPGAGHEVTRDMLVQAEAFLAADDVASSSLIP